MLNSYVALAVLLGFSVDYLLILATRHILDLPPMAARCVFAAAIGAAMTAISLLPGFDFLKNFLWRIIGLGLTASIAFGWNQKGVQCGIVFLLLSMALGGIAQGIGGSQIISALSAAVMVFVLCVFGFRKSAGGQMYVPVEVNFGVSCLKLTALRDTGNTLQDPITGKPVLVVGAQIAALLTGLTREQLRKPVETVGVLPGLRLIPYRTIGQSEGLLLAKKFSDVKIGKNRESILIAFAPEDFGTGSTYQALMGGLL